MKLGLLTPAFARGGAEEYVLALSDWARAGGHEVTVGLPEAEGAAWLAHALERHGIGVAPAGFVPEGQPFAYETFLRNRSAGSKWLRARAVDRAAVVLPFIDSGGGLVEATVLAGVPSVVVFQLTVPHNFNGFERLLYTTARRRGQRFVAVSRASRDDLRAALGWLPDAIDVVPNSSLRPATPRGPDWLAAARAAVRRELGVPDDGCLVLTVARVHPQKAPEILVQAAAIVSSRRRDVVFVWAGTGDGHLHGGPVHFIGHRDDVERCLAAADVFVLPSRYEGTPFAVIEAMAAGRPCVLSDIGPHRELADHGRHAWLVAVDDAGALASGIERLLQDRSLAGRLGTAAAGRAEAFAYGTSFRQLERLLEAAGGAAADESDWPRAPAGPRRRIAIFGAGEGGRRAFSELQPFMDTVAFLDSARGKRGECLHGRPVLAPGQVFELGIDAVVLASCWPEEMLAVLTALGYPRDRIELFPRARLLSPEHDALPESWQKGEWRSPLP